MSIEAFSKKCYSESVFNLKVMLLVDNIWKHMSLTQKTSSLKDCNIKAEKESIETVSSEEKQRAVYNFLYKQVIESEATP